MSDKLKKLLDYKHRLRDEDIKALGEQDIKTLLAMLKNNERLGDKKKAIIILSRLIPEKIKTDLQKIVLDEKENPDMRIIATTKLAELMTSNDEKVLIKLLSQSELPSIVALKAIKALGKIGTKNALEVLNKLAYKPEFQKMVFLSACLISCRLKIPFLFQQYFNLEKYTSGTNRIKINLKKQETILLERYDYYPFDRNKNVFLYDCGNRHFSILPTKELPKKASYPSLVALIVSKSSLDDYYSTNMFVFFIPESGDRKANLFAVRTDGLLCYAGFLNSKGGFELLTVKNFANDAAFIKGSFKNNIIEIDEFTTATQVLNKKKPLPFIAEKIR